jgi:ketosteroid isomerase-like protein
MSRSPREVFERLAERISGERWTELGSLYAEDTVVEHPHHPAGPSRLEGRTALAARFERAGEHGIHMRAGELVVHETTDPEVVVAEYAYDISENGGTARTANIQVLRVRDGLITHSRDYHDHFRMAALRGGLDALVETALERRARAEKPVERAPEPPTAPADSPRGVFERLLYGLTTGERTAQAEWYAEDAIVTHPFHPTLGPIKGREELREHFAAAPEGFQARACDLEVYQTTDPEVIVAEFAYEGVTPVGFPFRLNNIFVQRIRDGLIVESRDYGDHVTFLAAMDRLGEVAASYA